jgi:hypothetical protein
MLRVRALSQNHDAVRRERRRLRGDGLHLHARVRAATPPAERLTGLRARPHRREGVSVASSVTPRPAAHACESRARCRHQPQGRLQAPGARDRVDHARHYSHAIPALQEEAAERITGLVLAEGVDGGGSNARQQARAVPAISRLVARLIRLEQEEHQRAHCPNC